MTNHELSVADRVRQLALSFDRTFAVAPREPVGGHIALVTLLSGGAAYAAPLSEVGAVQAGRRIVPVPGRIPELAGVVSLRRRIVAVFDLASLLGHQRPEMPRWLVLLRELPLAFACEGVTGCLQFPRESLSAAAHDRGARFVRNVIRRGDEALSVLDLPALQATLEERARAIVQEGER